MWGTFLCPSPLPSTFFHFSLHCNRSPESGVRICHVPCAKWQVLKAASSGIHHCHPSTRTHPRNSHFLMQSTQPYANTFQLQLKTQTRSQSQKAMQREKNNWSYPGEPGRILRQCEEGYTGGVQIRKGYLVNKRRRYLPGCSWKNIEHYASNLPTRRSLGNCLQSQQIFDFKQSWPFSKYLKGRQLLPGLLNLHHACRQSAELT